jgi:hypothetical protein
MRRREDGENGRQERSSGLRQQREVDAKMEQRRACLSVARLKKARAQSLRLRVLRLAERASAVNQSSKRQT